MKVTDYEIFFIEEAVSALKRIKDTDCTEEVFEMIQAIIEDLRNYL